MDTVINITIMNMLTITSITVIPTNNNIIIMKKAIAAHIKRIRNLHINMNVVNK